ncbi:Paf1/RNA polymerase II complex, RTF1 component (involved in regulation of TATA box-binding protein) [Trachipleistophora hominis]|uniref:Paf1/RNA polymerase II complex, RTF1 component (Involved in regulation of TATA box-binding protein) n=1 Tax=Trachipleistophora hominis TaxID=72359 RepID=L7JWX5_TRAHO|nr:Paf1/RNA polymerase II complex, RTF1 component (involved in regulation of TATA box-binding protein) [Trachipleistophora hominis]
MGDMQYNDMNLYQDSEDEEKLMKLPEAQREAILYNRYMKIKKLEEKKEVEHRIDELHEQGTKEHGTAVQEECITYDMLCDVLVPRTLLAKNVYRPAIDRLVGNFVRVCFKSGYVVKRVEGMQRASEYFVEESTKNYRTNKNICIVRGSGARECIPMSFISNSRPSFAEYDHFKMSYPDLCVAALVKKAHAFKNAMTREMSADERARAQEERSKFYRDKRKNLMEKIRLIREREDAFKNGDAEKVRAVQKRIDEIDEKDKDPAEEKEKEIWDRINAKNRRINYEKGVRAGLEKARNKDSAGRRK